MLLRTPERPVEPSPPTENDVDAGVIEDARRRQHHQRRVTGTLIIAGLVVAGLIIGFAGGGGGSGLVHDRQPGGPNASVGVQPASKAISIVTHLPATWSVGLLAPGVGWAANAYGFYLTRDEGRSWSALSLSTYRSHHLRGKAVAGFGLQGLVGSSIIATASPTSRTLIVAFGMEPPLARLDHSSVSSACHVPTSTLSGAMAITSNAGRTWQTRILPGCVVAVSLSFTSAKTGFALSSDSPHGLLYRTTDAGRTWQRIGAPDIGRIDFTTQRDGWLLTPSYRRLPHGGSGLYHTTNGGRTWKPASICRQQARKLGPWCELASFYGPDGVVESVGHYTRAEPLAKTRIYTTRDDGRTWSTHNLGRINEEQHCCAPTLFTPNASDIYVSFSGGLLDRSTNGGRTWTRMRAPTSEGLSPDLDFLNADYAWAGSGDGRIEYTTDGGRHWKPLEKQSS